MLCFGLRKFTCSKFKICWIRSIFSVLLRRFNLSFVSLKVNIIVWKLSYANKFPAYVLKVLHRFSPCQLKVEQFWYFMTESFRPDKFIHWKITWKVPNRKLDIRLVFQIAFEVIAKIFTNYCTRTRICFAWLKLRIDRRISSQKILISGLIKCQSNSSIEAVPQEIMMPIGENLFQ